MQNLFSEFEMNELLQPKEVNAKEVKLAIVGSKGKVLSKNQQTFNKLLRKIEDGYAKIQQENNKLEKLLQEYSKQIPGLEKNFAKRKIELAKILGKSAESYKLGAKPKKDIKNIILWLCDEAFSVIEPDEKTIAFYDSWSDKTYKEELDENENSMKNELSEELKDMFGIDIDFSDIDNSPESFARFQKKLEEEMFKKQHQESEAASKRKERKKTAKQIEKENRLKEQEGQKLKSLRSIYLSLAKILHPDKETDPTEKLRKEELMKKVTSAYNEKDLVTLLKLEMEWVASESDNIEALTDDKLKLYIATLKEQLSEIEGELFMLYNNPRFFNIIEFSGFHEKFALELIDKSAKNHTLKISSLEKEIQWVKDIATKKEITTYVNQLQKTIRKMVVDFRR